MIAPIKTPPRRDDRRRPNLRKARGWVADMLFTKSQAAPPRDGSVSKRTAWTAVVWLIAVAATYLTFMLAPYFESR
ncbi:MAG: hypothetical protein QM775_07105 [Pirellulales bacterium]